MAGAAFDGAKVALFVGDRLVLIRRDDDPSIPYPGLWDFPGGGREGAETPRETAIRETREEVGADLSRAEWLHEGGFSSRIGTPIVFFVARLPAGTPLRLGDEGTALRLARPEEALALPDLIPSLAGALRGWWAARGGVTKD